MSWYGRLCDIMLCFLIGHVVLCCHVMLWYVMSCYVMQSCYFMSCYVTLWYVVSCYATSRYVMLCYAGLCYAMPCHVMLCISNKSGDNYEQTRSGSTQFSSNKHTSQHSLKRDKHTHKHTHNPACVKLARWCWNRSWRINPPTTDPGELFTLSLLDPLSKPDLRRNGKRRVALESSGIIFSVVVSHWSHIGLTLVSQWSHIGLALVSHWPHIGPTLVSHWFHIDLT